MSYIVEPIRFTITQKPHISKPKLEARPATEHKRLCSVSKSFIKNRSLVSCGGGSLGNLVILDRLWIGSILSLLFFLIVLILWL